MEIIGNREGAFGSDGYIASISLFEYETLLQLARVLHEAPRSESLLIAQNELDYWRETFLFIRNLAQAIEQSKGALPKTEGNQQTITIARVIDVTIGGK